MFVVGTEMDFVDNEIKSEFVFNNPNAKGTCGCGESFHVWINILILNRTHIKKGHFALLFPQIFLHHTGLQTDQPYFDLMHCFYLYSRIDQWMFFSPCLTSTLHPSHFKNCSFGPQNLARKNQMKLLHFRLSHSFSGSHSCFLNSLAKVHKDYLPGV